MQSEDKESSGPYLAGARGNVERGATVIVRIGPSGGAAACVSAHNGRDIAAFGGSNLRDAHVRTTATKRTSCLEAWSPTPLGRSLSSATKPPYKYLATIQCSLT